MPQRPRAVLVAFLVFILAGVECVSAQGGPSGSQGARGTFSLLLGVPVGELAENIRIAGGGELAGRFPLTGSGWISLRGALGHMIYGWNRDYVSLHGGGGCGSASLTTSNKIFFGEIGPEVSASIGNFRPFGNLSVGVGNFWTSTTLKDDWWDEDEEIETTLLSDWVGTWGMGAGLDVKLRGGRNPVFFSFGAQYHGNGPVQYLTRGDVVDNPDGSVALLTNVTQANLVSYRIGWTITHGLFRGQDRRQIRKNRRSR